MRGSVTSTVGLRPLRQASPPTSTISATLTRFTQLATLKSSDTARPVATVTIDLPAVAARAS